jgi:hypothetical protein
MLTVRMLWWQWRYRLNCAMCWRMDGLAVPVVDSTYEWAKAGCPWRRTCWYLIWGMHLALCPLRAWHSRRAWREWERMEGRHHGR